MTAINWTNITDLAQLPGAANTASNDTFWLGVYVMLYVILLLLLAVYSFEAAILASSFLMLIIGLFLSYAGLLAWQYVMIPVGVILLLFLYITWSSNKNR